MNVGYVRVSTIEQNDTRQFTIMEKYNVEKVFNEKISGKNVDRPTLNEMLQFVRKGDTLIIESYSRLARSTKDLLNIFEELNSKGVNIISDKENIDTTTAHGRLMFTLFAGLAEFERTCMLERQAEGIAEAKKAGKYHGRKQIEVNDELFKKTYDEWKRREIRTDDALKILNLKKDTFYRRIKKYEKDVTIWT